MATTVWRRRREFTVREIGWRERVVEVVAEAGRRERGWTAGIEGRNDRRARRFALVDEGNDIGAMALTI